MYVKHHENINFVKYCELKRVCNDGVSIVFILGGTI